MEDHLKQWGICTSDYDSKDATLPPELRGKVCLLNWAPCYEEIGKWWLIAPGILTLAVHGPQWLHNPAALAPLPLGPQGQSGDSDRKKHTYKFFRFLQLCGWVIGSLGMWYCVTLEDETTTLSWNVRSQITTDGATHARRSGI